jgi:hypothetical protein
MDRTNLPRTGGGRNQEADFRGQPRSNETHASTTDPEARLYRKGPGKEAKLSFMGHALMENRNSLIVEACLTPADGHAERVAALHMIEPRADRPQAITLGADRRKPNWEGFNEMDEVSGDGSAELLDDGSIEIEFAYRNGDEAILKAKRDTSSTAC